MELYSRDFLHSPVKTVRFGGTVADTLAKHKQVSSNVKSVCFIVKKKKEKKLRLSAAVVV